MYSRHIDEDTDPEEYVIESYVYLTSFHGNEPNEY